MTVDLSIPAAPGIDEVAAWDDAHRYTPAPRHRRRLLLKLIGTLDFSDVLDAGWRNRSCWTKSSGVSTSLDSDVIFPSA